jgi:hypothetical protein
MSYGLKRMRKLQFFKETSKGTAGPATIVWRGLGVLEDLSPVTEAPEDVGFISGVDRIYIPYYHTALSLDPIPATFEQLPYLLEMGIKKVGTGVADGGGSGKVYAYPFPTTATNDILTTTWEGGDNNEKEEASYFFATDITLSGKGKEAVSMSAKLEGRGLSVLEYTANTISFDHDTKVIADSADGLTDFLTGTTIKITGSTHNDGIYTVATGGVAGSIVVTESLVDELATAVVTVQDWFAGGPTGLSLTSAVEELKFGKSKLYLDAVDGTIGTTIKSGTLLAWTLNIKTGWMAVFSGDGNASFGFVKCGEPVVTMDVTLEFDGTARAEKAYQRAQTPRLLRLLVEGNALTTANDYTYKSLVVDLAGYWSKFSKLAEQDGNDVVTGTFVAKYDPTAEMFGDLTVVNEVAAL